MPNYKYTDVSAGQALFLTVNLNEQLLPGTFEYMLNDIIGTKIDISCFDINYKNDNVGASAIPPRVLLKLIIYGYYNGHISSRDIEYLNQNNIIAKALTGDMPIHFTTIASFISRNSEEIEKIFAETLAYSNELQLIGGEDFAIDGLRLPSNASIDMSGTREQLEKRLEIYRKMAEKHVKRHQRKDERGEVDEETKERYEERQHELSLKINKISEFLKDMKEKKGKEGQEIQSNVTDNESAMIKSKEGFIQGYIGIAVVDKKNQIIVSAKAVGSANEGEHLPKMLDETIENLERAGVKEDDGKKRSILGDPNYFNENNLQACEERGIEPVIPDGQEQRRKGPDGQKRYDINDFKYNEEENNYECPQGKVLEYKRTTEQKGVEGEVYQASLTDCKVCQDFSKCSWSKKKQSEISQGKSLRITKSNDEGSSCRKMREKLATEEYQEKYSRRIQIVEPVFGNVRYCKGLNRFTLRGGKKVNGQWQLYCIVHNLEKCLKGYNEGFKCA